MTSPRRTTAYLKWAYANNEPRHVYNCLSRGFIAANKISFTDIQDFWPRVRSELERYIGSIEDVEIADSHELDDGRSIIVFYESGEHRAEVLFVLETSYELIPSSGRVLGVDGTLPSVESVLRFPGDGTAVLTLPVGDEHPAADGIYRIVVDNRWKIDAILKHNLEQLEASIKEEEKKAP